MASAVARAYIGVCGLCPQRGPGAEKGGPWPDCPPPWIRHWIEALGGEV